MDDGVAFVDEHVRRWSMARWCVAAEISRRTFYNLAQEDRPVTLRIGKRVKIIESPREWERRMLEKHGGRVPTRRGATAEPQVA